MPKETLSQTHKEKLRTWIELDREAIRHNFDLFKSILLNSATKTGKKPAIVMPVVKSNAYGHGLLEFTREVVRHGAKFLGVDSFDEALLIRADKIKTKTLVFGYTTPKCFLEASEKNISLTISSFKSLEEIANLKFQNKLKIHIKVDTGLGRQGFVFERLGEVLDGLEKIKDKIEVEGLYTHLAVGEALSGKAYTMMQAGKLDTWYQAFVDSGYKPLRHICATSSTMFFPELHYDMVRIGIGSYGLWPSGETKKAMQKKYALKPVLSWKTIISETKPMPKGSKIGYDLTEELKRNSTLAVIPVGYWHGYPRALSSIGKFSVLGAKIKLVGRVSMDMVVLDITELKEAKIGTEVAIIGGEEGYNAEADKMAEDANTINYEIVTRINPQIKRLYKNLQKK